jgi:hypothetical protein
LFEIQRGHAIALAQGNELRVTRRWIARASDCPRWLAFEHDAPELLGRVVIFDTGVIHAGLRED